MIVLGIDPGEAWCGFAALQVEKRFLGVEARTYSTEGGTIYHLVRRLLPLNKAEPVTVVCEDFKWRPVGHQAFSRGATVRLIGALEYHTIAQGWRWQLVPPGSWKGELPKIFGNQFLASYQHHWPDRSNPNWDHCLSAWRVLGRYLLSEQLLSVLKPLRAETRYAQNTFWEATSPWIHSTVRRMDLGAPAMKHVISQSLKGRSAQG